MKPNFNLMSFNIKVESSADPTRLNAVTGLINNYNAGIVCLQEVKYEQYVYLNTSLKANGYSTVWYSRDNKSNTSGEGLAIAYDSSVWSLVSSDCFWLSDTPGEVSASWDDQYNRICVSAVLKHKRTGEYIQVFNVHLGLTETSRNNGIALILEKVNASTYPVYVAGDFNSYSTDAPYTAVVNAGLVSAQATAPKTDSGSTFQNWGAIGDNENTAIDFCFVSDDFTANTFKICRDKYGDNNYISDHYAIVTKVTWNIIVMTESGDDLA